MANFFFFWQKKQNKFKVNIIVCDSLVLSNFSILMTEAFAWTCSVKKMFLKILQNSQKNTCTRVLKMTFSRTLFWILEKYGGRNKFGDWTKIISVAELLPCRFFKFCYLRSCFSQKRHPEVFLNKNSQITQENNFARNLFFNSFMTEAVII